MCAPYFLVFTLKNSLSYPSFHYQSAVAQHNPMWINPVLLIGVL